MKYLSFFLFTLFFLNGNTLFAQCEGFSNYPLGTEAGKRNHYDYRQAIKKGDINKALPFWRKAMKYTPAGSSAHYIDGVKIYEYLIKQTSDTNKIVALKDSMYALFDQRITCVTKTNKKKGDILTRKAYTMYKHNADYELIYSNYKKGIELAGNKVKSFVLYPFAYVTVEQFKVGKITNKEAQELYATLSKIIQYNIENSKKETDIMKFNELLEKVDDVFYQNLEPAIFDCEYYSNIYLPMYEAHPDSAELFRSIYHKLVSSGCDKYSPILAEIHQKDSLLFEKEKQLAKLAQYEAAPKSKKAYWAYQDGDYMRSAELFVEGAAEDEGVDLSTRAEMCFKAAQICFANLKKYDKARTYAERALAYRPNWGKPYLLIGDLYASSGPLCGTGTGFKSQVVTWVAIDMWKKAKEIDADPFIQKKAQAQISKYTQYMPTSEDLHVRKLKEGQTYTVPCWIQRKTIVRAYNQYKKP
ncbi:MAG: tetratricopeptide repeat protein [Saprospiraceae bacterium]